MTLFTTSEKKLKCIKDKKLNKQQKASFQSIITHEPFELITTDYLHLNQSKGGMNIFLLWCTILLNLYEHFQSKTAAPDLLFNKYFLSFGFPKRI